MSYLLDTNIISEFTKSAPNPKVLQWIESLPFEAFHISVLTVGEIRKGVEKLTDEKRRENLRVWLENELPAWFENRILPINLEVAEVWGRIQRSVGRPVHAIDSLLAATALHFELRIVTRNTKNFNFPSLEVINPWN
jgi:predicted nucleic acid-binding protein